MKILVVDDDPRMLALSSTVLESGGYEVMEASTGKDALQVVREAHPDLVLLDVILTDMSGLDVCRQIKADPVLHSTFVVLHSGVSTSSEAQVDGLDIGADGYIVKGIPIKELLARVQSLLRIKQAEDALQRAHDELDQRIKARTAELAGANQRLVASEKALLERLRFEQLLSNISARFISVAPDQIDLEIERALKRIVDFFRVSQCVLIKGYPGENRGVITHAAHAEALSPVLVRVNMVPLFPWASEVLRRGEVVRAVTLDDLPAEAVVDKETYRKSGVRSVLTIPVSVEGPVHHHVSISSRLEEREWPEVYIPRLQLLGEILVSALERKQVREQLEEQLRFEALLAHLSARLIDLPSDKLDREIQEALHRICELFGPDRCALWQVSDSEPEALLLTHINQSAEAPPVPKRLDAGDLFPWTAQKILSGETLVLSRMADLPPEAALDREAYRLYGTKSIVVVPLSAEQGTVVGALSFALIREEAAWSETVVNYLQLVAHVLANALARKRADEALRESEERLSLAADSAQIGLWSVDIRTRHLWNSRSSWDLLGLDHCIDLTEDFFYSLVHPEDRETLRQTMEQGIRSGAEARAEYRIIRPDGAVRWLITRARQHYTPAGEPDRLTGVSLDVTDRKQMEQEVQKAAEEWQTTFDSVQDMVIILDQEFRIIRVNAPVLSFFNLPLERILGNHCYALMHGTAESVELCPVRTMMKTRRHEEAELFDEKRDAWLQVSVAPIFDDCGKITRVVHTAKDITQRKKAEFESFSARREMLRTQRLLRMGELTASLAHELNQPLTSILSNARAALRFLQAGRLDMGELREILEDIAKDDKRAGNIIRSLRSMVKPEEGEQQLISINDVLLEAASLFHSEAIIRNIKVETDCTDPLPAVNIDKVQIQQVLINLMMNAAESMLDTSENRKIIVRTRPDGHNGVQVAVCDFGPGVEENELSRLFEPFFTTKRSGLGMGLSLSRSILEAHGGHIWAENNPDEGATFYFDLPGAR